MPTSTSTLAALPAPVGGVLAISTNALHYCNQEYRCGLAVNGFAWRTVDRTRFRLDEPPRDAGICIELDTARATVLAPDRVLLSLKGGEVSGVGVPQVAWARKGWGGATPTR